jgi:hypothetical protein
MQINTAEAPTGTRISELGVGVRCAVAVAAVAEKEKEKKKAVCRVDIPAKGGRGGKKKSDVSR